MMKKLWQKNTQTLDSFIEKFETQDDLLLDQKLVDFDVYGSMAHATMLQKIGILSNDELKVLMTGLNEILALNHNNHFVLTAGDEDIHTKIENYLTEKYGNVGKKIHTGRSRNDQVLTAMRLFTKDKLLRIWQSLLQLSENFNAFAKQHEALPLPGFTHMQKAMPTTVGMWSSSFVEAFLDDLLIVKDTYKLSDQSPLGSAAAYGVPLPLDRQYTADLLGFEKVQINPMYAQASRGKIEAQIVSALTMILLDINKFATDVLFFTSSEVNYFSVSENLYSGSSIMPQKKNVDVAELLRSKVHLLAGHYQQIIGLSSNLISGYNRDLQDSKKPFMESLEVAQDSITAANLVITNLIPDEKKLKAALTPEIFATHKAYEMVMQGVPFREAYQTVGNNLHSIDEKNFSTFMQQSSHIGGTGNLMLAHFSQILQKEQQQVQKIDKKFAKALHDLTKNKTKK